MFAHGVICHGEHIDMKCQHQRHLYILSVVVEVATFPQFHKIVLPSATETMRQNRKINILMHLISSD